MTNRFYKQIRLDIPIAGRQFTKSIIKVSKGAKIRNRYNQVPQLTQDTNWKVTNSQLDTTNESQEVSPFPAGDLKAHINRRAQRHSKHKTEQKQKRSTKDVPPWNGFINLISEKSPNLLKLIPCWVIVYAFVFVC